MLDILIALKTCAGNSRYILPSRYDADAPMSRATFNRVTSAIAELARERDLPLEPFMVHCPHSTARHPARGPLLRAQGGRQSGRGRSGSLRHRHRASGVRPRRRRLAASSAWQRW